MTTKEKILEEIKDINYAYNDCSKYATIKNLLDEMEEGSGMDDLISRQAVIDLWDKYHHYIATKAIEYDRELRALPSAQPKPRKGRYIDAEELKHILNNSKYYGTTEGDAFADMITECETK